jgi:ribonucleoside-triphosphate reductase
MISLSNLSDDRMRNAKSGQWWEHNSQRALANNSVAYTEKPDVGSFMEEWTSLYRSKSGERGIFNREASKRQASKNGRRDFGFEFGTNPCSEIILRPKQFCNLTEVVVRDTDSYESLAKKVRLASILGTFQSTLTYFPYLSKDWKKNTEEERLLGLSLTGILDNLLMSGRDDRNSPLDVTLEALKNVAIETNNEMANSLGINPSTAITCVN